MSSELPYLKDTPNSKQLIVDGQPYLILGGELQNSSLSSSEYMSTQWQNLVDMNINTILGSVAWEAVEPEEGHFDFSDVDKCIEDARSHGLRLVLLWFGSFKNALSSYAPAWVKTNDKRFPRAKLRQAGGVISTADTVSLFQEEAPKADAKAFATFMRHLKEVDEKHHTVIMVQVENEPGILGDSRDASPAANAVFDAPAPSDLVDFLRKDHKHLQHGLKSRLKSFLSDPSAAGTWSSTFGAGPNTDELFMAYHYAKYINHVAEAGKAEYGLPLFVNAWQNSAVPDGTISTAGGGSVPGDYPSGGVVAHMLDIWQHFAPAIAFFSPDIYMNDYQDTHANYRHNNQPLFIPEQRRDAFGALRIWNAIGTYGAIGVSPFGIDTLQAATCAFTKPYKLLSEVSAHVLEAHRRPGSSVGFWFDELNADGTDPSKVVVREMAGFEITIQRSFVFGKAASGSGMLIHLRSSSSSSSPSSTAPGTAASFLLIGLGFQVRFKSLHPHAHFTGLLNLEEQRITDKKTGAMKTVRRLNGDETRSGAWAMMPNEEPDYGGYPIAITIPAGTGVARCDVYALVGEE